MICGAKVKIALLLAVPFGVVTVICPLVPLPTVAVMVESFTTVKVCAGEPPKATTVAPVKFAPVMVTTVPVPPMVGVNELIAGRGAVTR